MNKPIGSIGPAGMAGLASSVLQQADAAEDLAATVPEQAISLLAAMQPPRSPAERPRLGEDMAQSVDVDAAQPDDDSPSCTAGTAQDMAAMAPSIAGVLARAEHAALRRLPSDGAPIRKVDRRRKRRY
jgi:hypothetical protein